jgi:O-antigen ligase
MRVAQNVGWRSARWRNGDGAVALVAPTEPMAQPVVANVEELEPKWPWQGVKWSVPFVGFLAYVMVVITYEFNIGSIAMGLALLALPFSKEKIRIPAPLVLFALFYAIAGVSRMGSTYAPFTVGDYSALGKFVLIVMVGYAVLNSPERIRFFFYYYLALFALYPLRGLLFNAFIYNSRTQGRVAWNHTFNNPNDAAILLLFPLGMTLAVLATARNAWLRRAALIGMGLLPLAIFVTQSRGAIVALALGAIVQFFRMKRGKLAMLGGLVLVSGVLYWFAPKDVWQRLLDLNEAVGSGNLKDANDSGSANQRREIWKVGWKVASENPAIGVGYGAYPYHHAINARGGVFDKTASGTRDAHSTYLTVLAETGIPGFLVFFAMVVVVMFKTLSVQKLVRRSLPHRAQQLLFLQIGILTYFVAAIFSSVAVFIFTYLQLMIMWTTAEQVEAEHRQLNPAFSRSARPLAAS